MRPAHPCSCLWSSLALVRVASFFILLPLPLSLSLWLAVSIFLSFPPVSSSPRFLVHTPHTTHLSASLPPGQVSLSDRPRSCVPRFFFVRSSRPLSVSSLFFVGPSLFWGDLSFDFFLFFVFFLFLPYFFFSPSVFRLFLNLYPLLAHLPVPDFVFCWFAAGTQRIGDCRSGPAQNKVSKSTPSFLLLGSRKGEVCSYQDDETSRSDLSTP